MQATLFPVVSAPTRKLPLYLTSIGYSYSEVHVDRPRGYEDFHWLQTFSGEGHLILGEREYILKKGSGLFIYPEDPHAYHPITSQWITEWITFNGKEAAAIVNDMGIRKSGVHEIDDLTLLSDKIKKGYALANSGGEFRSLDTANYLFDMLVQILKVTRPLNTAMPPNSYQKLLPVINYIDSNYGSPLELNHLSNLIDVSPQYLCTLFKNVIGSRPSQYINHLRVSKAKELMLIHPEKTIAQIARAVGFESPSYFTSVFKKQEQRTPGQFIALHRM